MRLLIQKVKKAQVVVESQVVGSIHEGLCVLVGFHHEDQEKDLILGIDKLLGVRIFPNEEGKMHYNVLDRKAGILVVSQFTLYASFEGRRPSFTESMPSVKAKPLYELFVKKLQDELRKKSPHAAFGSGVFGAMMEIELINQGPLTFWIDTRADKS